MELLIDHRELRSGFPLQNPSRGIPENALLRQRVTRCRGYALDEPKRAKITSGLSH